MADDLDDTLTAAERDVAAAVRTALNGLADDISYALDAATEITAARLPAHAGVYGRRIPK